MLGPLAFSSHAIPIWSAMASLLDDRTPHRSNKQEPARADPAATSADVWATETGQRTAFLEMLMAEIAGMRRVIKAYEIDTDSLRQRLNAAVTQSLVLQATVEI